MDKYVEVTYANKPQTNYPPKLAEYLFNQNKTGILKEYSFPKYGRILDLGCGKGDYLVAFCQLGFKVEGFDQCQPPLKNYFVTLGNIEKPLPYPTETFDIVFSKSVIEHLYYPEKLVKEVYRILKKGGAFVCLTPDWRTTKLVFHEDFTHRTPFTINSLKEIFQIHEFKNITCTTFRQLPFTWKHSWLSFLCPLFAMFYHINTKSKIIRFSQEKMVLGCGIK